MIEITAALAIGGLIAAFAAGCTATFIFGKYGTIDTNGNGTIEKEEVKAIIEDAMDTFVAYKDAIDDIIEDTNIKPEDAIAYIRNINQIFRK
jgi:hypothetical protein